MVDGKTGRSSDSCLFNGISRGELEPCGVPFFGDSRAGLCAYCLPLILDNIAGHLSGESPLPVPPAEVLCAFCGAGWRNDAPLVHGPPGAICAQCATDFARSRPEYPWPESLGQLPSFQGGKYFP